MRDEAASLPSSMPGMAGGRCTKSEANTSRQRRVSATKWIGEGSSNSLQGRAQGPVMERCVKVWQRKGSTCSPSVMDDKLTAAMVANAPPVKEASAPSISSGTTTDYATRNTSCRILSDVHVWSSWICIQLWSADTQCADIQCADDRDLNTDTGKSASDFDGVNGKYSNSACCCQRLQGIEPQPQDGAFGGRRIRCTALRLQWSSPTGVPVGATALASGVPVGPSLGWGACGTPRSGGYHRSCQMNLLGPSKLGVHRHPGRQPMDWYELL